MRERDCIRRDVVNALSQFDNFFVKTYIHDACSIGCLIALRGLTLRLLRLGPWAHS